MHCICVLIVIDVYVYIYRYYHYVPCPPCKLKVQAARQLRLQEVAIIIASAHPTMRSIHLVLIKILRIIMLFQEKLSLYSTHY